MQQFGLTGRAKFIDENVPLKGGRAELEFEDFEKVVSSTILKNDSQPKSGNPKVMSVNFHHKARTCS